MMVLEEWDNFFGKLELLRSSQMKIPKYLIKNLNSFPLKKTTNPFFVGNYI